MGDAVAKSDTTACGHRQSGQFKFAIVATPWMTHSNICNFNFLTSVFSSGIWPVYLLPIASAADPFIFLR